MVEAEHAAGLDASAVQDLPGLGVELARLGGDHEVVRSLDTAQRTQPQAVEAGADDVTVVEDQGRGAVVLLLVEGEVLQHVPHRLRQRPVVLPGRRHEGDHRFDDVESVVEDARLEGLVQAGGVRLPGRTDDVALTGGCGGLVTDAVLPVGVQLTVVSHQPERLGHRRVRLGVGGEPGVEVHGAHTVATVGEVGEEGDDLVRVEPALENLGSGRQRQRVQAREFGTRIGLLLDTQQRRVGGTVRFRRGHRRGNGEDPLPDRQLVVQRDRTYGGIVDRHLTLSGDLQSFGRQGPGDDLAGGRGLCGVLGQEEIADTEASLLQVEAGDGREELDRQVDVHPGAVTDALGGHTAAVRDSTQGTVASVKDVVGGDAVLAGEKTHAAGAVLSGRVVQAECRTHRTHWSG